MPDVCTIAVTVGDSRKVVDWSRGCSFDFPELSCGKHAAKIEIFQRIGTAAVVIDARQGEPQPCKVVPEVPTANGLELQVTTRQRQLDADASKRCCSWGGNKQRRTSREGCGARASSIRTMDAVTLKDVTAPHLLVLTDAGEEVDDEGALWLLSKHLEASSCGRADVVFVTGKPLQRAMRWAQVLGSLGQAPKPGAKRIRYFLGPETARHMRYTSTPDLELLKAAGLGNIAESHFNGGDYDVVLQISPLSGFSDNYENPPDDITGALSRIVPRKGAATPLFLCVGDEGATNFPKDACHLGFKASLIKSGFTCVHAQQANYMNWDAAMLEKMPPKLVELILDDEWNKAVGRIPPFVASLFVRFRVNTAVNYDVIDRAYTAFQRSRQGDQYLKKANAWWSKIADEANKILDQGYVRKSRESDDQKGVQSFGSPQISERVKGMKMTWESIMSSACERDILASRGGSLDSLSSCSVDEILCNAVLLMTSKLLRIYAYNAFLMGREPDWTHCQLYLQGSEKTAPLDFRNFPLLHGDISTIQAAVVGNPMYDPVGMLLALVAMGSGPINIKKMADALSTNTPLLDKKKRVEAMMAAYAGEPPSKLALRYTPDAWAPTTQGDNSKTRKLLLLTDIGENADNEAALWLLCQQLGRHSNLHADIVLLSGSPHERALMRWAKIIAASSTDKRLPGLSSMVFYLGPEQKRDVEYFVEIDYHILEQAGMEDIPPFRGGAYDVILQTSPLDGFSSDFTPPASRRASRIHGVEHALSLIEKRPGASVPLHIVVGAEGSVNFPRTPVHLRFRSFLVERGFTTVFVDAANYVTWDADILGVLPSMLADLGMQDEWNKAVGRIRPSQFPLNVCFRVNTNFNYVVISRAFLTWQSRHRENPCLLKAEEWWRSSSEEVNRAIMYGYIKQMRDTDAMQGSSAYGNPAIEEKVKGQDSTWRSVISSDCVNDILEFFNETEAGLLKLSVDDVMCRAVTLMTGKLLTIFAFSVFVQGGNLDRRQYMPYILGNDSSAPLDFYMFPRMFGDMSEVKKLVVGNATQDFSGMLLAILVAVSQDADALGVAACLQMHSTLFGREKRQEVARRALEGEDVTQFLAAHGCIPDAPFKPAEPSTAKLVDLEDKSALHDGIIQAWF
eukprot:TRINITY_DN18362_c0_g2_i1.p1 TRINITY_DN18362_c0_g2~~TRINITY_DN18362_c0_g2_i1.p1  ORF type:complete len:1176 (+),score=192.04 TRINITY_DN18362_c0_g2_i1:128-3529(+)